MLARLDKRIERVRGRHELVHLIMGIIFLVIAYWLVATKKRSWRLLRVYLSVLVDQMSWLSDVSGK